MATNKQAYPDFSKVFEDFKVPSMDFSNVFEMQRRNIEALSAANQAMAESFQTISRRQAELMQEQVEDMLKTSKDVASANSPEAGVAKQAEFTKKWLTQSLNNFREIAEMANKSNAEIMDVLSDRTVKSMDEMNSAAKKAA